MYKPPLFSWVVCFLWLALPAQATSLCRADLKASFELGTDWHGGVYVPANVAGKRLKLLVDTGGTFSMLTENTVASLGLYRERIQIPRMAMYGGYQLNRFVRIGEVQIGSITVDTGGFLVMPDARIPAELSGTLAPDILSRFDVELDFARARFNLFSPNHCDGQTLFSATGAVTQVPVQLDAQHHIIVPVQVDGRSMTAYLDTGATRSEMSLEAAERIFGLGQNSAELRPLNEPDSEQGTVRYPFKSLSIGGVTVNNPYLPLVPNRLSRRSSGGPPLILGMTILRHYHLYIVYSERYLYLTPATAH
ncbi:MAG: aspartyl protease family protein [Alphaproteobacteria bacterium]|nr:aspartyl protease family protein [Alphaproteobacteria bacterium]